MKPSLINKRFLQSLALLILLSGGLRMDVAFGQTPTVTWTDGNQAPPITPGTAAWVKCPVALPINPPELGGQYGHTYDNTVQEFFIYIPNNFDPNKTYGVVSMIWGSEIQEDWKPIFDARDIIYTVARGTDNSQAVGYRVTRTITACNLLKKYYKIDTNRLYVAGHSGGAATVLGWACYDFQQFWKAAIVGCQFSYRHTYTPEKIASSKLMKRAVIEPLTDTNRHLWYEAGYWNDNGTAANPQGSGTKTGYELYSTNGYAIRDWRPVGGHIPPPAPEMSAALTWLDGLPDGTNYPAVARNQSVNVAQNTAKAITLVAVDELGEALTYSIVTQPSNGNVTVSGSAATYTPNSGFAGADSFTFKANDGLADSNASTVTVNVRANTAPVASTLSTSTAQNNSKAITLTATDANSEPLTYSIVTAPSNGTLTGTPPNITYVPNTNFNGSDSFTYKANDSYVDSNTATVNLTVTFINQAPVANNLSVWAALNTPASLRLSATDLDSTYLTYSVVNPPTNGTLSGFAPNIIYTPNAGYTGPDSFTFRANDGATNSSNATVSITVSATANATLIDHTFNEGTSTLNGTVVDAGTLKTATPTLAWVTASGTGITADGIINTGTAHQSAYVPLGSAIANGAIYELTVTLPRPGGTFVTAGFYDGAAPNLTQNMENNGGTAWFLRRSTIEVNRGLNYDGTGNGYANPSRTNSTVPDTTQTFTIKLDLTAANGTNNWGNMTVYAGDSATGAVMGGKSNVPFTSAQRFNSVGFSARAATGSITNLTLKRVLPDYTGTSATVSIAATDPNAAEAGSENGEFTLMRSGYIGGALDVTLALSGTATSGTDYDAIPTTVTFAPGQATVTMPMVPVPDLLLEGAETVIVTIIPASTYSVASSPANAATVTIADDVSVLPPTISIAATDATASETPTDNGLITLTRVGGNTSAALDVTVAITGSASNGVDYQTLPTTVRFNANETTTTLSVAPIDDPFVEGAEAAVVTIAASANYDVAASPNNTATVTIADDDSFAITLLNHSFNDGTSTLNGTVVDAGTLKTATPTLAWVTASGTGITADGIINTGTAHQSAYVPLGSAIANGAIYELTVTLAKPTAGMFVTAGFYDGASPNLTQNMENNGGTAWFLRRSTIEVNRGLNYDTTGNGYANPSRTNSTVPDTTQTFTIKIDLTAANGVNNWGNMTVYAGDSATGTVMGGQSNVPFTSAQHFNSVGFSARAATGSITSIKLTQITPVIQIAATDATSAEPGTDIGTFTVTRSVITNVSTTVNLTYNGTATSGFDYTALPATVTFAPGETTKTLTVTPLSDALVEGNETLVATVASRTGYVIDPAYPSATVTILDATLPPYNAWLAGFTFVPGADKTTPGDPDGDGLANVVEYATGQNPTVSGTSPITFNMVEDNGSTYLQLSVNRNPAVTNVLIEGLSTSTLTDANSWSTGTTVTVTNTSSVFIVRDVVPISTTGKRFLRLRFTLLP
jgi:hypothetical protein